mmetsp:Transcript_31126/g.47570  ORF Transcript_31126/g.47570 Transcript_31126/m.47570 type:complete len:471 (+) Transcript_31126:2078-3490(+)
MLGLDLADGGDQASPMASLLGMQPVKEEEEEFNLGDMIMQNEIEVCQVEEEEPDSSEYLGELSDEHSSHLSLASLSQFKFLLEDDDEDCTITRVDDNKPAFKAAALGFSTTKPSQSIIVPLPTEEPPEEELKSPTEILRDMRLNLVDNQSMGLNSEGPAAEDALSNSSFMHMISSRLPLGLSNLKKQQSDRYSMNSFTIPRLRQVEKSESNYAPWGGRKSLNFSQVSFRQRAGEDSSSECLRLVDHQQDESEFSRVHQSESHFRVQFEGEGSDQDVAPEDNASSLCLSLSQASSRQIAEGDLILLDSDFNHFLLGDGQLMPTRHTLIKFKQAHRFKMMVHGNGGGGFSLRDLTMADLMFNNLFKKRLMEASFFKRQFLVSKTSLFIFTRKVRDLWLRSVHTRFFEEQMAAMDDEYQSLKKPSVEMRSCVLVSKERCFSCFKPYEKKVFGRKPHWCYFCCEHHCQGCMIKD